jgi:sirohydrochlorin ferrochelatase
MSGVRVVRAGQGVLIGCSHGTRDLAGRATIHELLAAVEAAAPELDVREAFVDVQEPEVADVVTEALAGAGEGEPVVVVPLLLSVGFHVGVDIAAAVDGGPARAAAPLGPDDRLVEVLLDRLGEAGATPDDVVVLAAAGSSDPRAARAVEEVATALGARRRGPVTVGYGAGCEPTVPDAVVAARTAAPGQRVVIASYLLAPGHFHDRLLEAGADLVTAPIGADKRVAEIVLERYAAAAGVL